MFQLIALLVTICAAQVPPCVKNTSSPWRLPSSVIPSHYSLEIAFPAPDSNTSTFSGSTFIDFTSTTPTSCIVFHASELMEIVSAGITSAAGQVISGTIIRDFVNEMVIVQLKEQVPAGGRLAIKFNSSFRNNGTGIFRCDNIYEPLSSTTTVSGHAAPKSQSRAPRPAARSAGPNPQMYATQFENSDARSVFPCFDEPALKATFDATIAVDSPPDIYTVLFNTPLISSNYADGVVTARFLRTSSPLPTYLVAIAAGHFDAVSRVSASGTNFTIYTPRGLSSWALFALNISIATVDYFEREFEFSYSNLNSKLDQISVTGIIDDGMENQGLITYSPGFLLCDPATCQSTDYQMIALVCVVWFIFRVIFPLRRCMTNFRLLRTNFRINGSETLSQVHCVPPLSFSHSCSSSDPQLLGGHSFS
jgi:puromycin-sensitive aminopeptidase